MTIDVACQCGQRFVVQPQLAGQRVRCPGCGSPIELPGTSPPANHVRCKFCHEYVLDSHYDEHVEQHVQLREDGQQNDYATLPPELRDESIDFATAPRWYRHTKCHEVTGMPEDIIHTYLTDPWFYLADDTFCTGCGQQVPLVECVWEETSENLQAYTDRLRAAQPQVRPGIPKRIRAWFFNLFQ